MTRTNRISASVAVAAVFTGFGGRAEACSYHFLTGQAEPIGDWSKVGNSAASAAGQLLAADAAEAAAIKRLVAGSVRSAVQPAAVTTDATVTNWLINTTNVKGRSTDSGINAVVSQINADVQQVAYTATSTYIKVTSIPDYNMGPFGGIPNSPANSNATFRITRTPLVQAGTKTATGGGAVGVLCNGVEVFNASDQQSFNNQNTWHGNAGVAEGPSLDASYSHPQQQGVYHSHASPTGLLSELGASGSKMTLIGYAIDGFPIYGNYAPQNADGSGAIVPMTSSYQLRSINQRTTLADGTVVTGNKAGPAIDQAHPLGYYQEDFQYVAGSGTLDQYNGRFLVTPEYPSGTYAYFASVDASTLKPAYPYYIGPSYYGVVQTDNLPNSGTITVPADAVAYVPEPGMVAVGMAGLVLTRRRRS